MIIQASEQSLPPKELASEPKTKTVIKEEPQVPFPRKPSVKELLFDEELEVEKIYY